MRTIPGRAITIPSIVLALGLFGSGCVVDDAALDGPGDDQEASAGATEEPTEGEGHEPRTFVGTLGSLVGPAVATGTTAGQSNDYTPTCGAAGSAPDASFTWTAPESAWYTFSTQGSRLDTVLELRSADDPTESLGCNDDFGSVTQSTVRVPIAAGTTVLVVVDGAAGKAGQYTLGITQSLCESECDDPPNQCFFSKGTCVPGFMDWHFCYYSELPVGATCDDGAACTGGDSCVHGSCVPLWWSC